MKKISEACRQRTDDYTSGMVAESRFKQWRTFFSQEKERK